MNLLVDADILVFRLCWSHEKVIDWGEGVESRTMEPNVAKMRFRQMVKKYMRRCDCDTATMCLTSPMNYRYEVYPEYKANRVYEKKVLFPIMLKWIQDNYEVAKYPHLEADDVMGIIATKEPNEHVIATIDKDLDQIPGLHYNWGHDELYEVNKLKADRLFWTQIMAGDPTDNYYGIKGVGPKGAKKLLDETPKPERWNAILRLFKKRGYTEEYALQMARVARICRVEDYDFENLKPILWEPKEN